MVVRIIDNAAPQQAQKFTPAKFREWAATQLELAEEVHSCDEAPSGGHAAYVSRQRPAEQCTSAIDREVFALEKLAIALSPCEVSGF